MNKSNNQIIIVNAGGQYCHLIARRVREAGVQANIFSPGKAMQEIKRAKGIIISGGPSSVYSSDAPNFPRALFKAGIPILGICYGHQLLAHVFGGDVEPGSKHEYGEAKLEIVGTDTILRGLGHSETVWMSHGDEVRSAPPGFKVLARSDTCEIAAMADTKRKLFGVQFHPEVTDTPCGKKIIESFIFNACGCAKDWHVDQLVERLKEQIKKQARKRHVLFFVSGGVDSTVAFTLCTAALKPDRVTGVFVDTGFMRKDEGEEIRRIFAERGWHNVRLEKAEDLFLAAVKGISDPEEKRRIIGNCFLRIQQRIETELGLSKGGWMLGQGTIYPDTIESGYSDKASVIKTHHNRVPAIEALIEKGLVLEPVKEFYKDEVRTIGRELGLPENLVSKNPFPGPGLAVRCLCSSDGFKVKTSSELETFTKQAGLKAWTVPIRTVGVQGDHRSYSHLVILTGNALLKTFGDVARRITREVRATNRVAFMVMRKRGMLMKNARVKSACITKERLDLLREADAISQSMMQHAGLANKVWQFPVVLLPLTLGSGETIALRPVSSVDAMTARFADLPIDFIREMSKNILKISGIDMVLYDVTDKPPATIEWE